MRNIGPTERRWRLQLTLFALAEAWFAPGLFRLAFLSAAGYLALTAWIRFCPGWWLLRIDTREINTLEVHGLFLDRVKRPSQGGKHHEKHT